MREESRNEREEDWLPRHDGESRVASETWGGGVVSAGGKSQEKVEHVREKGTDKTGRARQRRRSREERRERTRGTENEQTEMCEGENDSRRLCVIRLPEKDEKRCLDRTEQDAKKHGVM